jgi:hypothetical protein
MTQPENLKRLRILLFDNQRANVPSKGLCERAAATASLMTAVSQQFSKVDWYEYQLKKVARCLHRRDLE